MAEKRNSGRTRNFATVIYPESAPEDWLSILGECAVPAFVSPLHNEDLNPTGEAKKEHYHVMIMFDSVKTMEQAIEIFDRIGGVGCEKVISTRGYARYLCHLDNPEKAQYPIEQIRSFGGADYLQIIGLVLDKYKAIEEMIDFCDSHGIVSYAELLKYSSKNNFGWFRVLCDNGTLVMKEYLKSVMWERQKADRERFYFDKEKNSPDDAERV